MSTKKNLFWWIRPTQNSITNSLRCTSLDGGFSLWEEYFELKHAFMFNAWEINLWKSNMKTSYMTLIG